MSGIRPGQAKGPYVGDTTGGGGGGGAPSDASYITSLDESASLASSRKLLEGQAAIVTDKGAGKGIEVAQRGLGFHDAFIEGDGYFWQSTDALKSGDWRRMSDPAGGYLEGIAQNNQFDRVRWHLMGDFDYAIHIEANSANSSGMYIVRTGHPSEYYRFRFHYVEDFMEAMGSSYVYAYKSAGGDSAWLRMMYRDGVLSWLYKINETDPWTLLHSRDLPFHPWTAVDFALDSANTARIYNAKFYDYKMGNALAPMHPMVGTYQNSGVLDATGGNVVNVNLTDNETLRAGNHPYPPSQMLLVRVRQDSAGGHTLSFEDDFRFSSDLPAPTVSTDPHAVDYLGFIYDETDQKWDFISQVKGF